MVNPLMRQAHTYISIISNLAVQLLTLLLFDFVRYQRISGEI